MSDYPPSFSPDRPSWRDEDDFPEDGLFTPDLPPKQDAPKPVSEPSEPTPAAAPEPTSEPVPEPAPPAPVGPPESEPERAGAHATEPVPVAPDPAPVEADPVVTIATVSTPAPAPDPAPAAAPVIAVETPPAAGSPAPRKRGPKFMTDEPTTRIEGQLYVPQYTAAVGLLARLKVENKKVPGRRRMSINSLIRVGMAVMLEHQDELHGSTENELSDALHEALRASMGKDTE